MADLAGGGIVTPTETVEVRFVATREQLLTLMMVIVAHLRDVPADQHRLVPVVDAVIDALRLRGQV